MGVMRLVVPMLVVPAALACDSQGSPNPGDGNNNNAVSVEAAGVKLYAQSSTPTSCPNSGVVLDQGVDLDADGVLDPSEVTGQLEVCNGENGADGEDAVGPTPSKIGEWDAAVSWGNHAAAGYLTTESDPIFDASPASSVTSSDVPQWREAYSWGDHAAAGYLSTESDPKIGALTNNALCRSDGAAVVCDVEQDSPQNTIFVPAGADGGERLAQALDSAQRGDVIKLEAGTYTVSRPLQVPDRVRISGAGPFSTTIEPERDGTVLTTIECEGGLVFFDNFSIEIFASTLNTVRGISCPASDVQLTNMRGNGGNSDTLLVEIQSGRIWNSAFRTSGTLSSPGTALRIAGGRVDVYSSVIRAGTRGSSLVALDVGPSSIVNVHSSWLFVNQGTSNAQPLTVGAGAVVQVFGSRIEHIIEFLTAASGSGVLRVLSSQIVGTVDSLTATCVSTVNDAFVPLDSFCQ